MTTHDIKEPYLLASRSIGILVPNYNGEKFIINTLSVFKTYFNDASLVVVDDKSRDNSVELIQKSNFRLLTHNENKGFAASVNTGIKYFKEKNDIDFVLVSNSDINPDQYQCSEILKAIQTHASNENLGVLGFLEDSSDPSKSCIDPIRISGFLFCIRLDIIDTVGFFDESFVMYGEETEFFRRVLKYNFEIVQSQVCINHQTEMSADSKLRNSWYAIRNCLYLELKSGFYLQFIRQIFVLLAVLFRIRGNGNDPSSIRVRRPGIIIATFMIVAAVFWNIFNYFYVIKSQSNPHIKKIKP